MQAKYYQMAGSKEEKRELGFLWKIISVFMSVLALIALFKQLLGSENGLLFSIIFSAVVVLGLSLVYIIKLKPAVNQAIIFMLNLSVFMASLVAYMFNLPYKNLLGGISIPFVLVLVGMWIYTGFLKEDIK